MTDLNIYAVDDHIFKVMLKTHGKTEETLYDDVIIIKEWMKTQPHLPEIMDERQIQNFLFMNKFSIERTKQKIDMYYTIRSLMPDIFDNINPEIPRIQKFSDVTYYVTLPKLTKEMCRVHVYKLRNKDLSDERDPYDALAYIFNTMELRLKEDRMFGDVVIYDMEGSTFSYLVKLTPTFIAKAVAFYEKVYSARVKALYVVNISPYFARILTVLKSLLKPKLLERFHVYQDASILQEVFSKELLPKDYGGEEKSLEELQELLNLKLVQYKERFDQLDKMRVNEMLRPEKLRNDELLGFHGNFKKLSVD